jgi:hypothetical protein
MENLLNGIVLNNGSDRSRISIGAAIIQLPSVYQDGRGISIGIPAGCIRVFSSQPVSDNQAMNCIPCKVKQVTLGKDTATLRLDGAVPLTAVIRRTDDTDHIHLQDMQVYAVFKDIDVRVLSGA